MFSANGDSKSQLRKLETVPPKACLHDTGKWVFCDGTHKQTDKQTDRHGFYMIELVQWADSVKIH